VAPKLVRALLFIWALWLLVSWASVSVAFKVGDWLVDRPTGMGGVIVVAMACGALGGILLWSVLFGIKYVVGKTRSRRGRPSHDTPPRE
jgi:hypothetical protein